MVFEGANIVILKYSFLAQVLRLFNSASYVTLTGTNTFLGPNRAKKCPRQAIQKDVPNEWCKFFICPYFEMLIPIVFSTFNLSELCTANLFYFDLLSLRSNCISQKML